MVGGRRVVVTSFYVHKHHDILPKTPKSVVTDNW